MVAVNRNEVFYLSFVVIDGHYIKVLVTNATGCNPQK
jgi:hypothetical protein